MTQNRFYSSTTRATTTTADPGTSGTTLTVADSTVFASLDGLFPYTLAINWGAADQELVNVTARPSSTTLTIVRGQDGTAGISHPIGAVVDHEVSARDFNEAGAHIGSSAGVHGLTGSVVGTTDVQTLSSKTLTTPTIGSFANANHTHSDATSGGLIKSAPQLSAASAVLSCTTSYQDIPNLSFAVAAGGVYSFEGYVYWQASATTTTVMVAPSGTCTATFVVCRVNIATTTLSTGGSFVHNALASGLNASTISGAAAAAATNFGIAVTGLIVVNAAGTLTLAAKEGAVDATIQAGGRFVLEQLA